jgi:nitronate monooxygenase
VILDDCDFPLVLAPLAGGPSTAELTAAVTNAGALGTLAFGYLSADQADERLSATRRLTDGPIAVNLFVPGTAYPDSGDLNRFHDRLRADRWFATEPGAPRFGDDGFAAKIDLLLADPVEVVSFAFGLPPAEAVTALHEVGSEVWVTITTVPEALAAAECGADALVVQGLEAGGHRGGPGDHPEEHHSLLTALQLVGAASSLPLIATGGIMTGLAAAAATAAGADGVALGTAFLDCPEAGTSPVHREALRSGGPTALTRAFTGRSARGIRNLFMDEYTDAPAAYPEVHFMTAPIRQAARRDGDPDLVNLWAGTAYSLGRSEPAADVVRRVAHEADEAIHNAQTRWTPGGPGTRWFSA